mgnify:CR=1 FL=1
MTGIWRIRKFGRWLAVLALAAGLAGCTTYRGETGNPFERALTWFSYIGGEDIRASCRVNGIDRYRFVYNGHYRLEIRGYDLTPVGGGAELTVRARGPGGNVKRLSFDEPFGPWSLEKDVARITNRQAALIVRSLSDDAAAALPAAGQSMQSYDFFWIVSACSQGRFRLNVFRWPKTDMNALAFVPLLLEHDGSGVPFGKARDIEGMQQYSFGVAINAAGDGLVGR